MTIEGSRVTDLTLLRGMPLEEIKLDFQGPRDAALLKSIPTLKKINGMPVVFRNSAIAHQAAPMVVPWQAAEALTAFDPAASLIDLRTGFQQTAPKALTVALLVIVRPRQACPDSSAGRARKLFAYNAVQVPS